MSDDFLPCRRWTGGSPRGFLDRRGIDHQDLSERDAVHLAYVLTGFVLMIPASSGPITGLVWIASALTAGGRYMAPELPGHAADLGDGGLLVDSVVLMAVVQRHFLDEARPGWTDEQLARDLSLSPEDLARAQRTLDRAAQVTGHPAVLGSRWWEPHVVVDDFEMPPDGLAVRNQRVTRRLRLLADVVRKRCVRARRRCRLIAADLRERSRS